MRRALFITAAVLLGASSAAAHRGTGGKGYVSTISGLKPNVLGVFVNIISGDDQIRLSNYSGKTIVVLGYDGEPYLRFRGSGVYVNSRSPAAELNRFRYPPSMSLLESGPPLWRRVAKGRSYAWHDHRIHWPKRTPPQVVEKAPDQAHKIFDWRIPARAAAKPFAIQGFLGYVPPPGIRGDDGRSGWVVPAVFGSLTASFAAALAIWVGARRRAGRQAP